MLWYKTIIEGINSLTNNSYKFWLFSDGTDDELRELTAIDNVEKKFFGNAIGDIIALSKTRMIIGSPSTFSGWGAYLGQVPIIFPKREFSRVLIDIEKETVIEDPALFFKNSKNWFVQNGIL
jgi:hypothetical protein